MQTHREITRTRPPDWLARSLFGATLGAVLGILLVTGMMQWVDPNIELFPDHFINYEFDIQVEYGERVLMLVFFLLSPAASLLALSQLQQFRFAALSTVAYFAIFIASFHWAMLTVFSRGNPILPSLVLLVLMVGYMAVSYQRGGASYVTSDNLNSGRVANGFLVTLIQPSKIQRRPDNI